MLGNQQSWICVVIFWVLEIILDMSVTTHVHDSPRGALYPGRETARMGHPPDTRPESAVTPPVQEKVGATKGIYDDRAVGSFVRKSYVSALCPVVVCPYLCTSEKVTDGAAWDGTGWGCIRMHGMERDGKEFDGMGWDGMGMSWIGCDGGTLRHATARAGTAVPGAARRGTVWVCAVLLQESTNPPSGAAA